MSILSFSFQGDTADRITAWNREIATYDRDSSKTLDDEIKIGTVLLRLPESQLKTHLLMRVDKLKKWTDFRDGVVAISRAIAVAQTQPTPMDIGAVGKGNLAKVSKVRKHGSHLCKLPSLRQDVPKMWKVWSSGMCVSIFWNSAAQRQGWWPEGQRRQGCECC